MRKMLFIYNPKAGTSRIRDNLSYILEEFSKHDIRIVVHPTQRAKDCAHTVKAEGRGYDMIVCSGGDGTLDEAVTGMLEGRFRTPIGYIPAGSTNDFASSLGISKQMRQAAADIASGSVFSCDVGKLGEKYFIYVAAFGAFTEVSYKTSQDAKNALGHLAYLLEGARSLPSLKGYRMRFASEEMSGEGNFLYGMITNSNSVGGFKGITGKDVTLNDGVFEVTLIKFPDNVIEYPAMINALINGGDHPKVIKFKTKHLEFFCEEEVPWTRDGEYGGSFSHAVIDNIPKALPIILAEQPAQLEDDDDDELDEL